MDRAVARHRAPGPTLVLVGVVGLATVVALAGTVRTLVAAGGLGALLVALGLLWPALGPLVAR